MRRAGTMRAFVGFNDSLGRNASGTQRRFVRAEPPVTTQRRCRTLVRSCFAYPSRNPNYTFSTK